MKLVKGSPVFYQRKIGNAIVEKDFLNYQFDRNTGEFIEKNGGWRDDLPETLPADMLTLEEALAKSDAVRGEVLSGALFFISPDSKVFPPDSAPGNPCWVVRSVEGGYRQTGIIDAVTGEFLGNGVPPPGDGDSTVMPGGGFMVSDNLRIAAQIRTEHGIIDASFHKGGEDTTARGDRVVWGYFGLCLLGKQEQPRHVCENMVRCHRENRCELLPCFRSRHHGFFSLSVERNDL